MLKINLFKIKKGKLKAWLNWCEILNTTRKKEARESMNDEKITHESFSIFNMNDIDYVLGMSIGEHLPSNPQKDINIKHREIKEECLEYITTLDNKYYIN